MKKIRIALLFFSLLVFTLRLQSKSGCAPAPFTNAKSTTAIQSLAAPNPTLLPQDTCLNKKFSVVFYIILNYDNTLPTSTPAGTATYIATYALSSIISQLNSAFSRLCVSFENCKVVAIPNYTYNNWTSGITDSIITQGWYTPKTINIYIPTNVSGPTPIDNYAYATPYPTGTVTTRDFIVLQQDRITAANNSNYMNAELIHAMGDFFGLPHTCDEISGLPPVNSIPSHELVNGSNGSTNGDGFEDTDADCWPQQFNSGSLPVPPCYYNYTPGTLDANSEYYTPPVDNFMSNYNCRCRFSQLQLNAMAHNIIRKRLYLH